MRIFKCLIAILALVLIGNLPSQAGKSLGTREEGEELARLMIEKIEDMGIRDATAAMFDPSLPFSSTRQGINVFTGSVLVGDNREPEMVEQDYRDITDLTGALIWTEMTAGLAENREITLKWYHYDTQEVYDFSCVLRATSDSEHTVMVCR
jgi:hypothetical protein